MNQLHQQGSPTSSDDKVRALLRAVENFARTALEAFNPQLIASLAGAASECAQDNASSLARAQMVAGIKQAPATPAADPFAPIMMCEEKDGKLIATISLRPGACVYLVSASGPRSPAIKYSADGPKHVLVEPLVEIPL